MFRAMLIMGLGSALVGCGYGESDGGSMTEPDWPGKRVVIDDTVIDRGLFIPTTARVCDRLVSI